MGNNNGMVLHLYKHLDSSMFDTSVLTDTKEDKEQTLIAFGNFDRLCFSPVDTFVDFLSESSSAYRWIGGRKDIMLYPLEADRAQRHFVFGEKEDGFVQPPLFIEQNGEKCQRTFLLVSMLYVSGRAKASVRPYNVFLDYCKDAILKIVAKANEALEKSGKQPLICEVFGTFNSSEIAVLWGTDQFTDVQYIIDQLRYMYLDCESTGNQEPIFISTYTIVALTGNEFKAESISGGAMIQLAASTMRGAADVKEYDAPLTYLLKLVKDTSKVDFCAGEYDYIIESLPPKLELLTKPSSGDTSGALYIENSNFKKYFSHSTTRLFYREMDIDPLLAKIDWKDFSRIIVSGEADYSTNLNSNWTNITEIAGASGDLVSEAFKEYRTKVLENIQSTSSLGCNLNLLFSDYVQCVNITPDRQWAKDLKIQFSAAIKVLNYLLREELNAFGTIGEWYIDRVRDVVSVLQKQISHVSDAGKLFFEEPCSHSESTSQYDLIFHMYYGAIKQILAAIYGSKIGKNYSKQSKLLPLLRFEPVPRIESQLFLDMTDLHERLIDISLPYDAWCEPGQYIPLLIHELYHYVAPVDRSVRNETFAKILLVELNIGAIQKMLADVRKTAIRTKTEPICGIEELEFNAALIRVLELIRRCSASYIKKVNINDLLNQKADIQWSSFEETLYSWIDSPKGYSTQKGNYGVYLAELSETLCDFLTKECSVFASDSADFIIMNTLIAEISEKCASTDERLSLTDYIRQVRKNWLPNLAKQLREILPDLGMIQLSKMSPAEYMLVFATFQDKMQNSTLELLDNDVEVFFRIGFILDRLIEPTSRTLEAKLDAFDELRDEFCKKYVAYVKYCGWSNRKSEEGGQSRAGKWFSFFKVAYEDYLTTYSVYHSWMQVLATNQFLPVCPNNQPNLSESLRVYFSALNCEKKSAELFKSNIEIVHKFQVQPFFEDLVSPSDEFTASASRNNFPLPKRSKRREIGIQKDLRIAGVEQLNLPITEATQQLSNTHKTVFGTSDANCHFWYRGTQNANFDVLPSVMVHFLDDNQMSQSACKGENASGTLWEYQRSILERFKYKADGAPEFINSASYTTSDYIALMQHYGQHTTYLDWSEDVYSSLYFALESEIQQDENPKYGGEDAALYILDPMLYNRARKMLVNKVLKSHPEQFCPGDSWFHNQGRSIQEMPDGHIPNLSITYNKNRYGVFSLDIPDDADVNLARKTKYLEVDGEIKKANLSLFELEMWNLPLAVYTSRLNPRIRSQSGQFIAFSPFSIPVYSKKEGNKAPSADHFSYLSLLKIQEYFLECFNSEEPFMYEIKICAFAKEALGRYLRNAGINRYRIYPELGNIKI